MVRYSREKIQAEVYIRLAYFDYEAHPELKPEKIKLIEKWCEQDPKHVLPPFDPRENRRTGWVIAEHVEQGKCPYGSPSAHRGEYLKKDPYNLIEHKKYSYVVKKPNQKNRREYFETIYRLKQDKQSRKKLFTLLKEYPYYFNSDYMNLDVSTEAEKKADIARGNIRFAITCKDGPLNSYGERDKEYLKALIDDLNLVLDEVKQEYATAKSTPQYVREERRKKTNELFLLKELMKK